MLKAKKRINKFGICILVLSIIGVIFSGCSNNSNKTIAFIPKVLGDVPYWNTVKNNIDKTALENGFKVVTKAPESESNYKAQKEIMQEMIKQNVSAIILAPCSVTEVISDIKDANNKGIPVILIDTDVNRDLLTIKKAKVEAFAGTDNYEGGKLSGERVAAKIEVKGNVAILNGLIGQTNGEARCSGFEDVVKKAGMTVVASVSTDWSKNDGYEKAKTLLLAYPDIKAIFAANENIALGAVSAMKELNKKILIECFDTSDDTIKAINAGEIDSSVSQHPELMAKNGVEAAIKSIKAEKVDSIISTKIEIVTKK